ncbi:MAG: hypothetical protein QNK03_04045 [Myxococcota bacterium]|nr:hypothetical protein [Myxococcota bacterium]
MVDLSHNGVGVEARGLSTVGDAIDAVTGDRDEQVLLGLRLDGHEVPETDWDEVRELALAGVGALALVSRPRREIALDGLESAADYAFAVSRSLARTAELLREGSIEAANDLYAMALDALAVLVHAIQASARALPDECERLAELCAELDPWLLGLEDAHRSRDWVTIADVLEHEVAARVLAWPTRLEAVRARHATGGTD